MKAISTETDEYIVENSVFRVGEVVSVEGRAVKVKVDKGKNTSSVLYKGDTIQSISVGGYIKIKKGFSEMIGKIEGESISEDKNFGKSSYKNSREKINRVLNVKILGFIEDGVFKRGIKELPLLDNKCFLLRKEEFNEIHKFVRKDDTPIDIGTLEYDSGQVIHLGINALFASHIGIFGNTGSGKSYTVTRIYRELFKQYCDNQAFRAKSEFFFVDFNGEYVRPDSIIDARYKNIYKLSTSTPRGGDKFPISERALTDNTFWSIFLEATEKTQTPFLRRAIKDTYIDPHFDSNQAFKNLLIEKIMAATAVSGINIDRTLTADFLFEVAGFLDSDPVKHAANYFKANLFGGNERINFYLTHNGRDVYRNLPEFEELVSQKINGLEVVGIDELSRIKRIGLRILIKYYDEMIRGFSNREHLSPLIKRLDKRVMDLEKVLTIDEAPARARNITIISLRDVNLDIRKMLPLLLCKELYDSKKKNEDKDKSLHLIIDEAHNILSGNSDRESAQWKDYRLETFEEIIKEGRKFGTFLTIASQRPSDISPTILSQLHNYFLHRLINNNDLLAVEKTIAYLDKVSADSIPNLATGTCIVAGLIAQIPVVVRVKKLSNEANEPDSQTIKLTSKWVVPPAR